MKQFISCLFFAGFANTSAGAQVVIKIEDVNKHIGDSVKSVTKIYGGRYFKAMQGSPTCLYAGDIYPNNAITLLISKNDRENFDDEPESKYLYKTVCITGRLEMYNGKPTIKIIKPEQIIIQE